MSHPGVPNQARRFPPLEVGERIPDELFGNVLAVTPQVERRIRMTAAYAVLATALILFADLERGPGVQTISLVMTVMLCLAAATVAGIRIVRLQRLAIDRLRCGQYPNGRDTPPDRNVLPEEGACSDRGLSCSFVSRAGAVGRPVCLAMVCGGDRLRLLAGSGLTAISDVIRTRVWQG